VEKYLNEIKAFLYGLIIYFQIDKDVSIVLITLIFIDMFAGAIKAAVVPEMEFRLTTFWAGLLKKSLLLIIIMVLALVSKGLGFTDFKEMVTIIMKIMVLNEGISIFNSIKSIYRKQEFKSNDFISILIEKIEATLTKYMDKLIKIFDENSTCL
jgi:toxin secretion/phage lysis holin